MLINASLKGSLSPLKRQAATVEAPYLNKYLQNGLQKLNDFLMEFSQKTAFCVCEISFFASTWNIFNKNSQKS